ncbi:MAG: hypothetical protein F7B20_05810 [Aeropyrum sp.]|nr:hypothetical protein [Aeropyrum sp.]
MRPRMILVAGLGEDSGKTTLALGIISHLRARGFNAVGFKPAGATNIWLHPEVLDLSASKGFLVTWDGLRLAQASGEFDMRIVNPVGGFILPPYPGGAKAFGAESILGGRIVLLRITECLRSISTLHLLIPDSLDGAPEGVVELVSRVAERVKPTPFKTTPSFVADILGEPSSEAADTCLNRLLSTSDVVVVESNSDVAAPTKMSMNASVVIVAGWGYAYLYEGDVWKKAVELKMLGGKPWSVKSQEILTLARPTKSFEIPVKTGGEDLAEELEELVNEASRKLGLD